MKELKLFVSQPMNGLSEEVIFGKRRIAVGYIARAINEIAEREYTIKVVNPVHREDAPDNASRLWYLGRAIQDMDDADILVLVRGWREAKGCRVEASTWYTYKGVKTVIQMDQKDPDESHNDWEKNLVRQVRCALCGVEESNECALCGVEESAE